MRYALLFIILFCLISCTSPENEPVEIDRVILICLDTFRYDHLIPEITPNIHEFAQESVSYTNCRSAASWTLPSITSVFTGKYPSRAGCIVKSDTLGDEQATIAEVLEENDWDTFAYTANSVISEERNFNQGFDSYVLKTGAPAEEILGLATEKLLEPTDSKTFLYIHLMEPHRPYKPDLEFREKFALGSGRFADGFNKGNDLLDGLLTLTDEEIEQLIGLYDAECAWADDELGKFFNFLKENDLWDSSVIIFFADHGEEFSENGEWFHGNNLYEETVHVPLIVKSPGTDPKAIDDITSLRTIGGRIFDSVGIETPTEFVSNDIYYMEGVDRGEELKGIISGDLWKLVYGTESGTLELYDLNTDPYEQTNLIGQEKEKASELLDQLIEIYASTPDTGSGESELTPELEEQLRALGYIH